MYRVGARQAAGVPRLAARHCSSVRQVEVPTRVERGPTDLLEALGGTLGKDCTAPQYKFHDDPWLIPYKTIAKRDFILAKESGRKAARFIMNKHPDFFEQNRIVADPPQHALLPRARYNKDNVNLELLQTLVDTQQVGDSVTVFRFLRAKGKIISSELTQSLLELVAFYNEQEGEEEGWEGRGVTGAADQQGPDWAGGGLVEEVYSEDGVATQGQRLAMLLGQGRHPAGKPWLMFNECKAAGDLIPVEGYNAVLRRVNIKEGLANTRDQVTKLLLEMREAGVDPNLDTLVSILNSVAHHSMSKDYEACCQFALDLLAEFRVLQVSRNVLFMETLLVCLFLVTQ